MQVADYPALRTARARLADEWRAADPKSPADIAEFYRASECLVDDLNEWHQTPERQIATTMLLHVARESQAKTIVDVGCGVGHDLKALREAGFEDLYGVEPNDALRAQAHAWAYCVASTRAAGRVLKTADLIVCVDVLEHLPDPEATLEYIATRAKVGAILFEMTATHDAGTPLHLKTNRGWHPGRCLERHGWWVVDRTERVRIWERKGETGHQTASLLACIYRSISTATHGAIMQLIQGNPSWRERLRAGDGLIARSRSILATEWWAETNDDVFLMVDDDVTFTAADAERLVQLCRNGHDIICGAYPVHNGEHFAIRMFPGTGNNVAFGEGVPPVEIQYAATGFMAVHRKVLDALIPTLPMVQPWSFYPLFQSMVVYDDVTGDNLHVSEDWGFCEMARRLGFKVWLDPQAILEHGSNIPVSVRNMDTIRDAVKLNRGLPIAQEAPNGRVEADHH